MNANPPPPPFPYSSYGGGGNGGITGANTATKLFDNSFTSSNIYSRSPPQQQQQQQLHSSSTGIIENGNNTTPNRDHRPPVEESPGSATKYIEKSLQSLDELINQRRSELMELRSSNNKRFSHARPPVAGSIDYSLKTQSPEDRLQQYRHVVSGGVIAGRASPASTTSRASSDSPSYVSIPAALFEEMSQSSQKGKLDALRIAELQDSVQQLTAQYEVATQRNKGLASKLEELEELRDGMEDELLSSNDELLFLRSQLQQKSIQVSELEMKKQTDFSSREHGSTAKQATSPLNGSDHSLAGDAEVALLRQELDDAIDENNKWYSKVQELEQQRDQLEEEKKYADSLVFDWEASYAQLEKEYMKIHGHLQSIISERGSNNDRQGAASNGVSGDANAADGVLEKHSKLENLGKAWKQAYMYQHKRALLRAAFDSMRLHMLQRSYVDNKATAAVAAAPVATQSYTSAVHESAARQPPPVLSASCDVSQSGGSRSHTTSFLLMLAIFQFIVWALILTVGYFYVEDLSPNFTTAVLNSLSIEYPALKAPIESIANLFRSEF